MRASAPVVVFVATKGFVGSPLEVRNDQQAPRNRNHVLRYRHREVWNMRLKDQSMAGFVTRECPYQSAGDTGDRWNEYLATCACRKGYTA